jgi:ABC-type Co2+ transport system permease subunit
VAFALTLLTYLNVGGFQRVAKSKVGMVGLVLLALALIRNVADALFDIDSPVWEIAGNTIATAFLACFVAFVVIRLTQRTRSRDSAR